MKTVGNNKTIMGYISKGRSEPFIDFLFSLGQSDNIDDNTLVFQVPVNQFIMLDIVYKRC